MSQTTTSGISYYAANTIDSNLITRLAKKNMINVHSEKYIKAWLDKGQYLDKKVQLQADYDLLSDEVKQKVEEFIGQRLSQPEGQMNPATDLTAAVTIKMGLEATEQNYTKACREFDFYAEIIKLIKSL